MLKSGMCPGIFNVARYVFVCLVYLSFVAHSLNQDVKIVRGSQDGFTNQCDSAPCYNCDSVKESFCTNPDCDMCRCPERTTFTLESATTDTYGRCLQDDHFRFTLEKQHSFLVFREDNLICLQPKSGGHYLTGGLVYPTEQCMNDDATNHWMWTKHSQLLNVGTLKCLQMADTHSYIGDTPYSDISLNTCDAGNEKQHWYCDGSLFVNNYTGSYMNYGNSFSYNAILFYGIGPYSRWNRGTTGTSSLCSQVSSYKGCYRYSDGQSMLKITELDIQNCNKSKQRCSREKYIEAPIERTNGDCSLQLNKTQFLNYSTWDLFPAEANMFTLDEDYGDFKLKVNLTKFLAYKFGGQIIKLYIHCIDGKPSGDRSIPRHDIGETHCVLIKTYGKFKDIYPVTPTSPTLTPTMADKDERGGASGSSVVTIVVVCLVVVGLIIGGVLAYVFYKRRKGSRRENAATTTHAGINEPLSTSGQSENAIYETEAQQAGKSECGLYDPGDEHVYLYAEPPECANLQPEEKTYHYATTDIVNNMVEEPSSSARYETCYPEQNHGKKDTPH